jgi:hypothetical protein
MVRRQQLSLGSTRAFSNDLRRTALTNMIEAGFSEKEAMEISGQRPALFLKQLGERLENHLKAKEREFLGQTLGSDKMQRCSEMLEKIGEPGGNRTRDEWVENRGGHSLPVPVRNWSAFVASGSEHLHGSEP